MTRTPSTLLRFVSLLVLGTCGRALAEDGSPQLLEHPSVNGHAACPCGCHQATAPGDCPDGMCGDAHAGRLYGGRRSLVGGRENGREAGPLTGAVRHLEGSLHSGQPCLDPWARADWIAANQAAAMSWHAGYYNTQYGAPVALVVPPTARMSTRWGWGVSQSTMSPIYPQFKRSYPGPVMVDAATGQGPSPLMPTPRWPSHTDQFGVYYVRGPW
jgi:hypothetical protein